MIITLAVALMSQVAPQIVGEKCSFCGACISVCPLKCLEIGEDYPVIVSNRCTDCGLCSRACPIINMDFFKEEPPVQAYYSARTKLPEVAEKAQDGGVVTTILLALLEEGYINSAIVTSLSDSEPLKPVPILARTREDILKSSGSKYSSSPNLAILSKVTRKDAVGLVGVPCQIRAMKLIENMKLRKLVDPIKVKIGLFCMENYKYKDYIDGVLTSFLKVKPYEVTKANIKAGKLIIYLKSGEIVKTPVHVLKNYVRTSCKLCPDLTAEFADISVGGIGSERGWSTVLIRTDRGKEVFDIVVKKGYLEVKLLSEKGKKLIAKLSSLKKENAKEGT